MISRLLTGPEKRLLKRLLDKWGASETVKISLERMKAIPLSEGARCSLRLIVGKDLGRRAFGQRVVEVTFKDIDGVTVIAALNVDKEGRPFELDIWKTDFTPVIQLP